ncbi:MAG: hypothetical protein M1812_000574 [Candelaria pacifica]|nr:MAG: hypothetical protein M1812_000574 [Candelaria pacifica]
MLGITDVLAAQLFEVSQDLPDRDEKAISAQWHDTVAGNYIKMWNGDLSYLNKSLAPNVVQYIDRLPTGNGSIEVTVTNSTAFKSFIDFSREPYAQYTFTSNIRIGVDNIVALRWTLSAVPKTAPANLTVAINGTDILILNRCSGLIEEVQGSSDTINFSHQLGQTLGKV